MLISDALGHYTKTVSPSLSVNIVFFTSGADIKFLRFLTIVIFGGWGGGGCERENHFDSFCKKQAPVGVGRFKYKLVQNVSCCALFSLQLDSKFLESTSQNLEWEKILSILFIVRNKHWPSV